MAAHSQHPEHVVPLTSAADEMEAGVIVAALEEANIKSTMTGVATAEFRVGVPGQVQILVAQEDFDRAQEVLDAVSEEQQDIDWSQVDVGQPEL